MPAAGSVVDPTASELTIGCADPIAYTLLPPGPRAFLRSRDLAELIDAAPSLPTRAYRLSGA